MAPVTCTADLDALLADSEMAVLFLEEAREHLGTIETLVLQLEQAPADQSLLDAVYRPFHTIKGNAYAIGAHALGAEAHAIEDLLDRVRSHAQPFHRAEADAVLHAVDSLLAGIGWLGTRLASGAAPEALAHADAPIENATVKVDTNRLDSLVDIVGELVILEAMIREGTPMLSDPNAPAARQFGTLRRLLADLQRMSLSLRMRSLAATFRRIERAVRDVSQGCGKPVDLVVSGAATELDRRVIEQLGDPLLHLVRNAIDHGLETPAARAAAGKAARGTISLTAFHKEGMVCIEVADDGAGLDTERIRATAAARGVAGETSAMSDAEIHQLIFEPGFSTTTVVTDVSGRGVGMDVVRRNIEDLGGRIDLRSTPGSGTVFTLMVPLTMAIVHGVLVAAGGERYVLPTHVLREVLAADTCEVHGAPGGRQIAHAGGTTMPYVELVALLGGEAGPSPRPVVLLIDIDGRKAAVKADAVLGIQEFVVKPLATGERVRGFTGGAVLGDGRVGLILDPIGVFELMELAEGGRPRLKEIA